VEKSSVTRCSQGLNSRPLLIGQFSFHDLNLPHSPHVLNTRCFGDTKTGNCSRFAMLVHVQNTTLAARLVYRETGPRNGTHAVSPVPSALGTRLFKGGGSPTINPTGDLNLLSRIAKSKACHPTWPWSERTARRIDTREKPAMPPTKASG
jgi:hypothetical protein